MSYLNIMNPTTGKKVNVFTKTGQTVLKNYINQLGGYKGPCALNPNGSGLCIKSSKADGNCKVSTTGKCVKKPNVPQKVASTSRLGDLTGLRELRPAAAVLGPGLSGGGTAADIVNLEKEDTSWLRELKAAAAVLGELRVLARRGRRVLLLLRVLLLRLLLRGRRVGAGVGVRPLARHSFWCCVRPAAASRSAP